MSSTATSLILKAQDNIDTAKKFIDDNANHEVCGYNLAQASEFFLKALLSVHELDYPEGEDAHDLDALMAILEDHNFSAISSHADIVELTPYNTPSARIRADERLDMKEYLANVEDLKKLVKETVR